MCSAWILAEEISNRFISPVRFIDTFRCCCPNGARDIYLHACVCVCMYLYMDSDWMGFDLEFNGAAFRALRTLAEVSFFPSYFFFSFLFFLENLGLSRFIHRPASVFLKMPRNKMEKEMEKEKKSHKRIVATQSEIQLRRPIKCDGTRKNTCAGCWFYTHTHTHTHTLAHTHTHLINYSWHRVAIHPIRNRNSAGWIHFSLFFFFFSCSSIFLGSFFPFFSLSLSLSPFFSVVKKVLIYCFDAVVW